MNGLIDTHSHIDMIKMPAEDIIKEAADFGVEKIIVPSDSSKTYNSVIELSEKFKNVYCAIGVHPIEVLKSKEEDFEIIEDLVKRHSKIVAIGEIGLDFYWDKTYIEEQKRIFKKQVEIAKKLNLPILIHDREAHFETFETVKDIKDIPVVMHCFSGGTDFAKECIKKGFYLAFGGVITFKNSKKMKEVVKNIPLDNILIETDAPYLTPEPFRGKENHPAYVKFVAEKISEILEIPYEEIVEITNRNAKRIFNFEKN